MGKLAWITLALVTFIFQCGPSEVFPFLFPPLLCFNYFLAYMIWFSSFVGNRGLCGKQIQACKSNGGGSSPFSQPTDSGTMADDHAIFLFMILEWGHAIFLIGSLLLAYTCCIFSFLSVSKYHMTLVFIVLLAQPQAKKKYSGRLLISALATVGVLLLVALMCFWGCFLYKRLDKNDSNAIAVDVSGGKNHIISGLALGLFIFVTDPIYVLILLQELQL